MMSELDGGLKRVFLINIAFALCYYLVAPLFPLFLDSIHLTESQIGLILGIGSFSGAVSTLISGYLADRFGTKTMFYASVLSYGISILVIAYTGQWVVITLLWMVFNLSQSLFEPVRLSYIGERATKENRAKLYGFMNLAWPIAGIIGPILSGRLVESMGWAQVFLIASAFSLSGIIPLSSLESSQNVESKTKTSIDRKYLPALALHFVFHMFLTTAIGIMNMAVPIYLSDTLQLDYSLIGLFFTVSNIVTMFTQIPSGALADRFGMKKTSLTILSVVPFITSLWIFSDNWIVLLASRSLMMGLWSMTWGATTVLVADAVPENLRGTSISVRMTAYRVGYTIGPIISGYLFSNMGGVTPFIAATIAFAVAIPIGLKFKESPKASEQVALIHEDD